MGHGPDRLRRRHDDHRGRHPSARAHAHVTTWGWIHLLLGLGVLVLGIFLLTGAAWARWTGIAIVAVSTIANFAWVPYYPVWGIIVLALDGAVIWALTVDPRE